MSCTVRTMRVVRTVPARPRKFRSTIIITVLCTVLAMLVGFCLLGTFMPSSTQPARQTITKFSS